MSCQCEVTKKYGEGIQLTEEEVKTFYEQVSKEETYKEALNIKSLGDSELSEEKFLLYIKTLTSEYSKVLVESNKFLLSLRKKYNCKDLKIVNDILYPVLENSEE